MLLAQQSVKYGGGKTYSFEVHGEIGDCPPEEAKRSASHRLDGLLEDIQCAEERASFDFNARYRAELDQFNLVFISAGFSPIRVDPIPNQYGSPRDAYYLARPWAEVQTTVGKFVVGWRKRVIEIRWDETRIKSTATNLFPGEDVTKNDRMIHAWSLEKAAQYLKTIYSCREIG